MDPQLLAAVVGGGIGIVGAVSATLVGEYLSRIRKRSKIASLLMIEVQTNINYAYVVKEIGRNINSRCVLDTTEISENNLFYPREDIPQKIDVFSVDTQRYDLIINKDVYRSTIIDQGVLHRKTIEPLHRFYQNIKAADIFWDEALVEDASRKATVELYRSAARHAENAIEEVEENNLTSKLQAESSWNPFSQP